MNAPDRLAALRVNPDWAKLPLFDRKGWRRLPFGAFADSINERVEPADAADEPYVGLDDLDSGDLHIRRWGKGSDVIGTKLRFRKGDIIFGRRRAYQRKLAVAEFDGICSAHAMVVRAKPAIVIPEFLPFLMMSDRFMKRAVDISVGSLSPTINWTTLKSEEFDLPPLDQQHGIARILAAGTEQERLLGEMTSRLHALRNALVEAAVKKAKRRVRLEHIARSITSGSRGWAAHYASSGSAFVRITNLKRGSVRLDWGDTQYVRPPKTKETERTRVAEGDLLISITADLGLVAVAERLPTDAFINQHIAKVSLDRDRYDPYLAAMFLSLPPFADQFRRYNDQGAKAGMNLKNVGKLELPEIETAVRAQISSDLQAIHSTTVAVDAYRTQSATLQRMLNALAQ